MVLVFFIMPLLLFLTTGCQKKTMAPTPQPQSEQHAPQVIKEPHLDANWYSKNPQDLNQELEEYLELAIKKYYVETDPDQVKALIVPHAGLYYSGLCAATAYQTLLSNKNLFAPNIKNSKINHVVILAPDHSNMSFGITLPEYTSYKTPLGEIMVNSQAIAALKKLDLVKEATHIHSAEHSIEIQLPWLQKTIESFTITPLIVGNIDQYDVKKFLQELKPFITENTLIVATTDLTHHGASYRYQVFQENIINYVRALDSAIIEPIIKKDLKTLTETLDKSQATICGYNPLFVLLSLFEALNFNTLEGRLCSYYTSAHIKQARAQSLVINSQELLGDIPDAEAQETVSYAALMYSTQPVTQLSKANQLTGYEKQSLTTLARESIENELAEKEKKPLQLIWPVTTPQLSSNQGAFVTLHDKNNQLRGCIGRITSVKPMYQTTQDIAISAAFRDDRFGPVSKSELDDIKVSVTILSQPEKAFALSNIVLGKHGIILNKYKEDGTLLNSAVFLPEVPVSMGWNLATTLTELSKKAGLGADEWRNDCELQLFEGYEIKEEV